MQIAAESHLGRSRKPSESHEWLAESLSAVRHVFKRVDFGKDRTRSSHRSNDNVSIATRDFIVSSQSHAHAIDSAVVRDRDASFYWEPLISSLFMEMVDDPIEQPQMLSVGSSSILEPEIFDELQSHYSFADYPSIVAFLVKHDHLHNLLLEAPEVIRQYFGFKTQLSLKLSREPDAVDDQRLFLLIHTTQPLLEAMDLLENLDDAWWLDRAYEARGKMSLDISPL